MSEDHNNMLGPVGAGEDGVASFPCPVCGQVLSTPGVIRVNFNTGEAHMCLMEIATRLVLEGVYKAALIEAQEVFKAHSAEYQENDWRAALGDVTTVEDILGG